MTWCVDAVRSSTFNTVVGRDTTDAVDACVIAPPDYSCVILLILCHNELLFFGFLLACACVCVCVCMCVCVCE